MISFEEAQEMGKRIRAEEKRIFEMRKKTRDEELRKMGIDPDTRKHTKPKHDHPSTPDDGFITVLYIIGMVGSLIFKDFWVAWIGLTILYSRFITRHNND